MKHARLVLARRGARGGYWLAKPADEVTVADVIRAVEGPLANIHESAPEDLRYEGAAERLRDVWVAVRHNLRAVLESVTLAELAERPAPVADRRDAERSPDVAQALTPSALGPLFATALSEYLGQQRSKLQLARAQTPAMDPR